MILLSAVMALFAVGWTLTLNHGMFASAEQACLIRLLVVQAFLTTCQLWFSRRFLDKLGSGPSGMRFDGIYLYRVVWGISPAIPFMWRSVASSPRHRSMVLLSVRFFFTQ